ncbi:MAG: NYN domain-containing protein [Chloroflexi bacterium]|nr:NYN domain-containing protein [Chloroflexota bacterium]
MYEQRRPDVAVFIDFENVYVSVRDKLNANPNFEAIMDRCGDLGRVVISRAYADWYRYPRVTSALYANAIEPIYVATYYYDKDMGRTGRAIKNSVDMNLCIDAMKTLFTNPNISKFVLVTGDRDFIPLVNSIRQQGKEVYIIGIGGAASTHLAQSADEFVFYEQLVGKTPGGSAAATAIASRATELTRNIEAVVELPSREGGAEAPIAVPPPPTAEPNVYDVLVEAIHLVRKRGYVSTLGSIKLVMKELMGGDFKESRYRDLSGRSFAKFKDFVVDAEKRGKVQIFTSGTVNEVFLPGEDPYKLSQFASALNEEVPVEPVVDVTVLANGRKDLPKAAIVAHAAEAGPTPAGRRRRRRSRRGQGLATTSEALELQDLEGEFEEPDYAPPVDEQATVLLDHELQTLELEPPIELVASDSEDLLAPPGEPAVFSEPSHAGEAIEHVAELVPEPEHAGMLGAPEAELAPLVPVEVEYALPAAEGGEAEVLPASAPPAAEGGEPAVEAGEAEVLDEHIDFSDDEWALFRTMMAGFSKPASFQQIFDTLRDVRKEHNLTRTNEQLRSMVKQAINSGLLERSGRGKRVYYTLKAE